MGILSKLQDQARTISLLYVEDEESLRVQTSAFLEKFFTSLHVCKNGREGLESFKKFKQDIVVSDIRMPELDGLLMCEEIRKIEPKAEIIITTAFSEKEQLLKAIDLGVNQYLIKPIDSSLFATELLKSIRIIKLEHRTKMLMEKIQNIINFQDDLVCLSDLRSITACNKAFLTFFGFRRFKELKDSNFSFEGRVVHENGYFFPRRGDSFLLALRDYKVKNPKIKILNPKNSAKSEVFIIKINKIPKNDEYVITLSEISDFDKNFKELEFKTTHDPLTRIFNRLRFDSMLEEEIEKSKQKKINLVLIAFDIDDFKFINSSFGEDVCDIAIVKFVSLVQNMLSKDAIFARRGDDEFAILISDITLSKAFVLCEDLRKEIEGTFFENIEHLTCSFGVVELQEDEDSKEFSNRVQKVLRDAKEEGKNCTKTDMEVEKKVRGELYEKEQDVLLKNLEVIKAKNQHLNFYIFYKELPVKDLVKIDSIDFKKQTFKIIIPDKKIALLHKNRECFFEHPQFTGAISANFLESSEGVVTFHRLLQISSTPIDRKNLRVVPPDDQEIEVLINDTHIKAVLDDISLSSLSFHSDFLQNIMLGMDLDVYFNTGIMIRSKRIHLHCRVMKIIKTAQSRHKVVLLLLHTKESENLLLEYISRRQLDIIKEINSF